MNKKVIDLSIGEKFKFFDTVLVVRVIDKNKGKIQSTKITANWPYGIVSHSFYSHKYDDLMNRVEI